MSNCLKTKIYNPHHKLQVLKQITLQNLNHNCQFSKVHAFGVEQPLVLLQRQAHANQAISATLVYIHGLPTGDTASGVACVIGAASHCFT